MLSRESAEKYWKVSDSLREIMLNHSFSCEKCYQDYLEDSGACSFYQEMSRLRLFLNDPFQTPKEDWLLYFAMINKLFPHHSATVAECIREVKAKLEKEEIK